jgi:hypothetical protein
MVLLASSFDQSKYFRAEDLAQEKLLRIESVSVEMVGRGSKQEQKPVVWFTNHTKGLALNKTNNRTIRGAYGDDMEGWAGKLIVVYPTQADFGGKMVGALRVRIPPPNVGCCARATGSGQTCCSNKTGPGSAAGAGSGSRSG